MQATDEFQAGVSDTNIPEPISPIHRRKLDFSQLPANRSSDDRFATSWSIHRGCHFFLWKKEAREVWEEFGELAVMRRNSEAFSAPTSCFGGLFRCFGAPINAKVQHNDNGDRGYR